MDRRRRENRVRRIDMENRLRGLCKGKGALKVYGFKAPSGGWMPSMDVMLAGRKIPILTDLNRGYEMLRRAIGGRHPSAKEMVAEVDKMDEMAEKEQVSYIDDMCEDNTDCLGNMHSNQTTPYQKGYSTRTKKVYNLAGQLQPQEEI